MRTIPADPDADVIRRYHTDAEFHALVHLMHPEGFRDDNGVLHDGPTVWGAIQTARMLETLEAAGLVIAWKEDR